MDYINPMPPQKILRDEIAVAAMREFLGGRVSIETDGELLNAKIVAKNAYGIADAMLAEKSKFEGEYTEDPQDTLEGCAKAAGCGDAWCPCGG